MLLLTAATLFRVIPVELGALGMSIAVVVTGLRLARFFLVRLVIDFDGRNGDGVVMVERLVPVPNLPEAVQISLQDAAEGVTEVSTKGILNTLITILRPLKFLRFFSVGDLKIVPKYSEAQVTIFSIQDPVGVKGMIQDGWKKISGAKAKAKAEKERREEIERMTIAVAEGLKRAQEEFKVQIVMPVEPSAPPVSLQPDDENNGHGGAETAAD